jgi:hypothetical protein
MKLQILLIFVVASVYGQATINPTAINVDAAMQSAVLRTMASIPSPKQWPTELVTPMTTSDTVLTVVDGTGLGAGTVIAVGKEHMTVTARAGVVLTVTRSTNGSTAVAHSIGEGVHELKHSTMNRFGKELLLEELRKVVKKDAVVQAAVLAAQAAADAAVASGVQ